jgi:MoxR-like ATPase
MAQIFSNDVEAADALKQSYQKLKSEIAKVVVGQDEVIRLNWCSPAFFVRDIRCWWVYPDLAKTLAWFIQSATSLDLTVQENSVYSGFNAFRYCGR